MLLLLHARSKVLLVLLHARSSVLLQGACMHCWGRHRCWSWSIEAAIMPALQLWHERWPRRPLQGCRLLRFP